MRVAIVGGNFLGCATAHYLRRALDANRGPAGDSDASEADDIVIFERSPSLGGHKFSVTRHCNVDVLTGSAADSDLSNAPLFNDLLSDAGIEPPARAPCRPWAIFDWDKDQYRLSSVPSSWLLAVASSPIVSILCNIILLTSSAYFAHLFRQNRLRYLFRDVDDFYGTLIAFWMAFSVFAGFGIVPLPLVARFWNWILMTKFTDMSAKFVYGASPEVAREIVLQFRDHLEAIRDNDSATSAITVGHLMSCCGMAKYAKVSASELLNRFHVGDRLCEDLVSPGLSFEYAESRFKASHTSNGVAVMLNMMTRLQVPTSLRFRARYLDVNSTKTLCPKLANTARARLQVCTEVLGVSRGSNGSYELKTRTSNGDILRSGFDAVILAATVDPEKFDAELVVDSDLVHELALMSDLRASDSLASFLPNGKPRRNTARFMSVVTGKLRASYFNRQSRSRVAANVIVINGVDCSSLERIAPDTYRVLSADKLEEDSLLTKSLFDCIDRISSWERASHAYVCGPLRCLNGREVPGIVLGTRFINAAATDRVANHVEIDCMSARNAASFFKDGVVNWK